MKPLNIDLSNPKSESKARQSYLNLPLTLTDDNSEFGNCTLTFAKKVSKGIFKKLWALVKFITEPIATLLSISGIFLTLTPHFPSGEAVAQPQEPIPKVKRVGYLSCKLKPEVILVRSTPTATEEHHPNKISYKNVEYRMYRNEVVSITGNRIFTPASNNWFKISSIEYHDSIIVPDKDLFISYWLLHECSTV